MAERTLIARLRPDPEKQGTLIVASPAVGMADGAPGTGVFLNRLDSVLTIRVLGARYVVRLPRDVHGWVVQSFLPARLVPVAFDDPLLRIDPHAAEAGSAAAEFGATAHAASDEAEGILVSSPTEGIFYRRPSPDAPAFVEVGTAVDAGTVLGLVEVMKCFNQITYGGPGLPPLGRVVRILADDASEVRFGQPLFRIEARE